MVDDQTDTAPTFTEGTTTTRTVAEGTAKGTNIGSPVAATDTDTAEKLTYWLVDNENVNLFDIDPMTGQLKVDDKLDADGLAPTCTDNSCTVNVNVTDSAGNSAASAIIVTVNVTGVNEKPYFDNENTAGIQAPASTIEHPELSGDPPEGATTYTATDPENDTVTLSLEGLDASKFKLNDPVSVAAGSKVLAFRTAPDFEMPGDSNRDNVYQVTVKASDGPLHATHDVLVKVTDENEGDTITVAPPQPRVDVRLTATLGEKSPEFPFLSDPAWQWRRVTVD